MFALLRSSGRRARSGPVTVHYVPAASTDGALHVAYAVPRRVGTAVERNTFRRRLRAIVAEESGAIPAGTYLIGVGSGVRCVPYEELRRRVIRAMEVASGGTVT